MRARFLLAVGALAAALALLVPSVAPLTGSMDAFASDLANGTFRPFGPSNQGRLPGLSAFSSSLGGLTGVSAGNFLPGATELPPEWAMDRDGTPGFVTIDHVFDPSLGAMKRLKAYDRVDANGTVLEVDDSRLRRVAPDPFLRYDTVFSGHFQVKLSPSIPVPIYSPHPKATVQSARIEEGVAATLLKDGADTFFLIADHDGVVTLNITYRADSDYYTFDPAPTFRVDDYSPGVRPVVSAQLKEDAQLVLARAGVQDPTDVVRTLQQLNEYFRGFEEGDIPPPSEVESLYLALAAGGKGCCRHRAFAYMITAQAVGIPTRVVVNEAHAFVEVLIPTGRWYQINLGGCGTYRSNNPENHRSFFDQADDPRREANPDEGRPILLVPSVTEITDSPARIQKGETYFVNGTVQGLDGRPVPGARIDVFLNETKDTPGRLTGADVTGADGTFSVKARVPKELPARSYQLVARSQDGRAGDVRFEESWSDPPIDVFSPTRFLGKDAEAAVGVEVPIRATLVDVDGNPVAGALVTWRADGSSGDVVTDPSGRFTALARYDTAGARTLDLAFAGNDHYGPAEANIPVRVRTAAILLPVEAPILPRGEEGTLSGTVAIAGASVANRRVDVTLTGFSSEAGTRLTAFTDTRGRFTIPLVADAGTPPGTYELRFVTEGIEPALGTARVAIQPTLTLTLPETVRRDDDFVIESTLRSDTGDPLEAALITLTFDGNETNARRAITNRTGVATFTLAQDALDDGAHVARVTFTGNDDHVDASASAPIEVVGPATLTLAPWLLPTLLATLLIAALGTWALGKERPVRKLLQRALAGALLRPRRHLQLRFPEHPPGVAPVLEPSGTMALEVRATRRDGRPTRMRIRLEMRSQDDTRRTTTTTDATTGLGETHIDAPAKPGRATLTAHATGFARLWTRPTHREILVASYREAIERAFVALRSRAHLGPHASAGDLVDALAPRLNAEDAATLREAARLFDLADYSEHVIERSAYHRFAIASLAIERAAGITREGDAPA